MRIGVPREIKPQESRVALTPEGAGRLVHEGHEVLVELGAGAGSGFPDAAYEEAGARLVGAREAWDVELVLKVKEPLASELPLLAGQYVFTYFHLAGVPRALTETLLESRTTAVAYETVVGPRGDLPLLAPMSAIAGDMAPVVGASLLARVHGGKGTLLGSVLGRSHGRVAVLGDGVVGRHAARTALGLGAQVVLLGLRPERAAVLRRELGERLVHELATPVAVRERVREADVVVGAVLRRGARAPHVVTEDMVRGMEPGSVVVDVSIDQGGCVETSTPTTHEDPVRVRHGVLHYGVTNMPGAYPRTSTVALTAATLPYVRALAGRGLDALLEDPGFAAGVQTHEGWVTARPVAEALGLTPRYRPLGSTADPAVAASRRTDRR